MFICLDFHETSNKSKHFQTNINTLENAQYRIIYGCKTLLRQRTSAFYYINYRSNYIIWSILEFCMTSYEFHYIEFISGYNDFYLIVIIISKKWHYFMNHIGHTFPLFQRRKASYLAAMVNVIISNIRVTWIFQTFKRDWIKYLMMKKQYGQWLKYNTYKI
jgi:hypothetical protein